MKNLNLSTCLLLMWALVSPQANASLETWGQNLDLTIPSLETPSTLVLDSRDKHAIMRGWTCCYQKKHIDSVRLEHSLKSIGLKLKENQNRSLSTLQWRIVEPPTTGDWVVFIGLQIADVYTTYRGLKYDCVRELNPIVGEKPSVGNMVFTKSALLIPSIKYDLKKGNLSSKTIKQINGFMLIVVGNNYQVWHDSEKNCRKI